MLGLGFSFLAIQALFGHAVEVGVELIELALCEGVVLVVVALGASQRRAEKHGSRGGHAVDDVLGQILFGVGAPLEVDHDVAMKTAGDFLIERGPGQQVAGDLLDSELVEGQVAVQRADDPFAVAPHVAMVVDVVAVGVGIAGQIEPFSCAIRSP